MRSVKQSFTGNKDPKQQPSESSEAIDLRASTHAPWSDTNAAGAETVDFEKSREQYTFEKPRQQYTPLQPEFPESTSMDQSLYRKEHPVQQGIGEWNFPATTTESVGFQERLQTQTMNIPVEVPLPQQAPRSPKRVLEKRVVTEQEVRQVPVVESETRVAQIPVTEDKVRMVKQNIDVPIVESTERLVTAPVQEAVVSSMLLEQEVPVSQPVRRTKTIPKVVMRPKVIDFPIVSKVKKVLEVEIEQEIVQWEKRTIEEPTIEYEDQETIEEMVTTELQSVEVPVVEQVTKEVEIPITEQHVFYQPQEIEVPVVEKQTRIVEQPVMQDTVKMVPQVVDVPVEQTVVKELPPEPVPEQQFVRANVQLQLDVDERGEVRTTTEASGQQQAFGIQDQETLAQKQPLLAEGQYNIQHDASKAVNE